MTTSKSTRMITSISPKTLPLLLLKKLKNYQFVRNNKITVKSFKKTELLEEDQGIGVEREDGKDAKRP